MLPAFFGYDYVIFFITRFRWQMHLSGFWNRKHWDSLQSCFSTLRLIGTVGAAAKVDFQINQMRIKYSTSAVQRWDEIFISIELIYRELNQNVDRMSSNDSHLILNILHQSWFFLSNGHLLNGRKSTEPSHNCRLKCWIVRWQNWD